MPVLPARRPAALDLLAAVLLLAGVAAAATGLLPGPAARATLRRALPLLVFLGSVVVLAELLAAAQVFDVVAVGMARLAGGSYPYLFGLRVLFAVPQLAAIAVGAACLWVFHWRRRHRGADRYDPPQPGPPADRPLFLVAAATAAGFAAGVLAGVPLEFPALAAALVLVAAFAVRRRPELRPGLLPWRLLVLVVGLFLVLGAADRTGFGDLLRTVVGASGWRSAAAGAVLSDVVNNLPAYVALEPAVGPDRLLYLLAGTNLGPLALPWGSLATVIWFERVRAAGLPVDWCRFVATGTVTAVLTLAATIGALRLT